MAATKRCAGIGFNYAFARKTKSEQADSSAAAPTVYLTSTACLQGFVVPAETSRDYNNQLQLDPRRCASESSGGRCLKLGGVNVWSLGPSNSLQLERCSWSLVWRNSAQLVGIFLNTQSSIFSPPTTTFQKDLDLFHSP
ncbi:unnamed protein product [Phytophthora fragariaefolia]|uniref:Unnamed protein product n=1 Tax=Phytophthora fragariaefolia TaxID=1490495 RepID=A0A9W7D6Q9_9STRA|nr:unnamed protein product [Phytophthora fragariaefolia]